jgi:lysophospholipase L1-like esterase
MSKRLAILAAVAAVAVAASVYGYFQHGTEAPAGHDAYWHERVSFFEKLGSQAGIVMVGDSLIDGAEWHEMFPGTAIANRAISGDTTGGVLERMDGIVSVGARKAFVMLGINDFTDTDLTVEAVFDNYRRIVARLEQSGARVFVQSTLMCNEKKAAWKSCAAANEKIARLNGKLAGLASAKVAFVDINRGLAGPGGLKDELTYDGVHLNGDGYRIWRDEIAPFVRSAGKPGTR